MIYSTELANQIQESKNKYLEAGIHDNVKFVSARVDKSINGNIFIELVNFFDTPNLDMGIIEKIYQFQVFDTITYEKPVEGDLTPITDITLLLEGEGYEDSVQISKNNP